MVVVFGAIAVRIKDDQVEGELVNGSITIWDPSYGGGHKETSSSQ